MKKINENKETFGWLYTSQGNFELLNLMPNKHNVPWYFKDNNIWSFYVVDGYGVAKNIIVGGEFLIEPFSEPKTKLVTFFVEGDEDTQRALGDLQETLHESD